MIFMFYSQPNDGPSHANHENVDRAWSDVTMAGLVFSTDPTPMVSGNPTPVEE
jgi:hypothetical protein